MLTPTPSFLPNLYLIIPCKVKQLPVSEYPEAWQLMFQVFLQTKCGFRVPKGWVGNKLLAPSLATLVVLLGESISPVLPGAWTTPCREEQSTSAGGYKLKSSICVSRTSGSYGGNVLVEK